MNAEQTTGRVWNRRRTEKQRRLTAANVSGKVIPTEQLVDALEHLLTPGDRVVLEGNNQKQADFLSRMLAEVNPQKVHDLHMIMPSVGRSEHLDLFEKVSPASSTSPSPAPRACAFRSCWRMVCWKSAPFTPISSSTPACTSIFRRTSR
ncbi:malonate decarboxylase, alpha subunit [Raoultella terrigena]|uniref:Malonate decarboxylase, alpha subunit n=1 Tax=Raoultella terrigena TaxID=577 RepID=A0A4U9CU54_RAOTE|nr:malonate decarboxylase, alpha subunit [Raoultella terrigena]